MARWHLPISATACCCWWRSGRLTQLPCRRCCYSACTPPPAHSQGHCAQGRMVDNFYLAAMAQKHCFKVQFSSTWWHLSTLDPSHIPHTHDLGLCVKFCRHTSCHFRVRSIQMLGQLFNYCIDITWCYLIISMCCYIFVELTLYCKCLGCCLSAFCQTNMWWWWWWCMKP